MVLFPSRSLQLPKIYQHMNPGTRGKTFQITFHTWSEKSTEEVSDWNICMLQWKARPLSHTPHPKGQIVIGPSLMSSEIANIQVIKTQLSDFKPLGEHATVLPAQTRWHLLFSFFLSSFFFFKVHLLLTKASS